ncbi:MEF2-activating motif and SAP domain-containing transcriptional regulator [Varanus komodoensis]|uniref:MEF2-activating motif and SAP domain-containing transcriptional regulator n=1 Tax=Varanus komodoensis TaxID=61221 RepID=UPI001CF7B495|nr:MEF2-activating motif and SAP domain-containing transcriptional regulator [Varanus komodoensis]
MTLLASERSMLIRSKFRSVLQLRMQHRRSQEQLSERHLIPGLNKPLATFSQPSGTEDQKRANEIAKLKVSPRSHKTGPAKSQPPEVSPGDPSELQDKKARLAEDLSEKILHRPGPLELVKKNILPLDPGIKKAVTDATPAAPESFSFEEDLSSSSSSSSSSPCFALSPGSAQGNSSASGTAAFQVSELRQQLRKRGLPVSGTKPALLERLKPYQVSRAKPPPVPLSSTRLAPADLDEEAQALREKQRVAENLVLKLHQDPELKPHHEGDLRVELEMHKRIKNRRKGAALPAPSQQGAPPPYVPKRECTKERGGREDGFMVLCPPSCEPINSDMELPLEITASPSAPAPAPGTRSLEEELQEAIQKAQLVPSQSIEEILEEPLMCTGNLLQAPALTPEVPDRVAPSPLAHQEASPPKKRRSSSELPLVASAIFDFPGPYDFLSTASSSSASLDSLSSVFSPDSLEMPPSPPDAWRGNGTRAGFDPVDWLEALTSGSTSGLGSASPAGSSIFCTDFFDSPDLGVTHMIDLMVEQW